MAENMETHSRDVWAASEAAFAEANEEADVLRFEEDSFIAQPDISIDYAVMEKAQKIAVVPAGFGWSDVGSWDAVAGAHEADQDGNSKVGADKVQFIDTRDTHIESTSHTEKVIATIGVDNVVIIDTPDALLVAERSKSQDVKLVVEALKASLCGVNGTSGHCDTALGNLCNAENRRRLSGQAHYGGAGAEA
jgi:mannose-1-phosphate guanylyltransferase/mannose-6-phosphate isomerase